jgi:Zn-finger nucleic acid-binding protein
MIKKQEKKIIKKEAGKITKKLVNNVAEPALSREIKSRKKCPICKINLLTELLHNTEIDYCPKCLGSWFDEDELRLAKDNKDESLKWVDVNLWEDKSKFKVSYGIRLCPSCRMPLYEIYYGDSGVIVDICSVCRGVWLDRAEFKKIVDYLKKEESYKVINEYAKVFYRQLGEVFSGPETMKEEILDFIAVLKLFSYKFSASHPILSKIIAELPR